MLWLRQHLIAAGYSMEPTGIFSRSTYKAVRRFQARRVCRATAWSEPGPKSPDADPSGQGQVVSCPPPQQGRRGVRFIGTAQRTALRRSAPVRNEIAGAKHP